MTRCLHRWQTLVVSTHPGDRTKDVPALRRCVLCRRLEYRVWRFVKLPNSYASSWARQKP